MIDTLDARASQPELFLPEEDEKFLLSAKGRELALKIENHIYDCFEDQRQPGVEELLLELERGLGWQARWVFWSVVRKMRKDTKYQGYLREYLTSTLSDDVIRGVLSGGNKFKNIHKSTLDELFRHSAEYRNSDAFREMVTFTARFREYAPYNNMLVKIQNPSCSYYATAKHWREEFNRRLKDDARPMLILAPMHPVMLVYDLDQTFDPNGEAGLPQKLKEFTQTKGELKPEWMERLMANAERDGIQVQRKELSSTHGGFATTRLTDQRFKMRVAIHDGLDDASAFSVLCHELAHIHLGHLGSDKDRWWPCRINLSHATVEIEAEATAYIVSTQLGLTPASESYLSTFIKDGTIPSTVSLELITKVAGKIADMTRKIFPARKKKSAKEATQ